MTQEQMKWTPEDLREVVSNGLYSALPNLIERIAHSEQTLRIMQETQANHDWWVKRAGELEQALAALEARNKELEVKIAEIAKPVTVME